MSLGKVLASDKAELIINRIQLLYKIGPFKPEYWREHFDIANLFSH